LVVGLVALPGGVRAQGQSQRDLPGPIDSLQDLQDTGKMLFKLADTNNDGQISQKEAGDAGNLMVGGFFFRADANGDGTLSKQEAQQARDSFLNQKPLLRIVLERARPRNAAQRGRDNEPAGRDNEQPGQANTANPRSMQGLMSLLDTNNDGQLQAAELRQMVQTSVQSLYAAADTNRDGQLSPSELNAAVAGAADAAAQAAFQSADADGNGALSQAEFDRAIVGPAHAAFRVLDTNSDNQISPQEARAAQRVVVSQIRMFSVPEPANSARNLMRSGRAPREATPVPNFGTPDQRGNPRGTRPAPAPGTTPAPAPRQPE